MWWHPLDSHLKINCTGEGNGNPLQYSCLENPMDRGASYAAVHGIARSQTWLSNFTFTFHFHALEKEMGTHSRVLAWRIPGMGEPGRLPSLGSHRVGHDWSNLAVAAAAAAVQYNITYSWNDIFIFTEDYAGHIHQKEENLRGHLSVLPDLNDRMLM